MNRETKDQFFYDLSIAIDDLPQEKREALLLRIILLLSLKVEDGTTLKQIIDEAVADCNS